VEFWRVLEHCIKALPARMARAFALVEMDESSGEEACKVLEVTATNLWVMLHRARSRLRHCLEERWFVEDREER
jgi:RNA polymerase sigma-70 factor (ECF subfamily)